jgi:muconolactone D-isomerase
VEFLVTLTQDWAVLRERPDLAELTRAERQVGRELVAEGAIVRIWRLPGRRANIGIWHADDATQLCEFLDRLPLRSWMDAEVVPLALHPLEQAPS